MQIVGGSGVVNGRSRVYRRLKGGGEIVNTRQSQQIHQIMWAQYDGLINLKVSATKDFMKAFTIMTHSTTQPQYYFNPGYGLIRAPNRVLQSYLHNQFKFEFELSPYACLLIFTHFKMVKHRNKLHIQNLWIFLIFLDILFVQFGVSMNQLLIFKDLTNFWNFCN